MKTRIQEALEQLPLMHHISTGEPLSDESIKRNEAIDTAIAILEHLLTLELDEGMPNEVWAKSKGYANTGSAEKPNRFMIGEWWADDEYGTRYTQPAAILAEIEKKIGEINETN